MVLLWAETSRRVPLAPSLLLQYWLAVSVQPGSYQLQVGSSSRHIWLLLAQQSLSHLAYNQVLQMCLDDGHNTIAKGAA